MRLVTAALLLSPSLAFVAHSPRTTLHSNTVLSAIAMEPPTTVPTPQKQDKPDFSNVALSGLQGKALRMDNLPTAAQLRAVIPKDCFQADTLTSLGYLSVSTILTGLCTVFGVQMLSVLNPASAITWPFWAAYDVVTGTVAMGLWVLAHECGHGAFSPNKKLQNAVGYVLHSIMLTPYYSWQRSHAVHHQYTNHMDKGETHVPEPIEELGKGSHGARSFLLDKLGKETGLNVWGGIQLAAHLIIGWPAYLLIGATGGPSRGMTNHYWPNPLTEPKLKELFPGKWKSKVMESDIGIGAVLLACAVWASFQGIAPVMALYGGPLLVVNAWLVVITWLQHTDVDVPHFEAEDHSFVRGALHTIDRPYDKMLWGAIDFLHHKIGTTHVAHHFDSTIPHYKAQVATDAIKEAFPDAYLYDPTPVPEALWRIAKGCAAVEKKGEYWVWQNEEVKDVL